MRLPGWFFNLKRTDHISDALASLHWLRAPERIKYKVAVLTYKVINGSAPRYLGTFERIADQPGGQRIRSAATNRLCWFRLLGFPPSAAVPSRSPVHKSGTICPTK
jgi:hypothetical protein